ncbi:MULTISPECIES: hypothetical protein [unclassified Pseudomonas]|uniref:hypothetical protein n=1 Tax=unclassified Pseudomonas TaxID=196821 RepID=UPI001483B869|nr:MULTISPECIES: hypothetical protein [unclassified Pseudomonas]
MNAVTLYDGGLRDVAQVGMPTRKGELPDKIMNRVLRKMPTFLWAFRLTLNQLLHLSEGTLASFPRIESTMVIVARTLRRIVAMIAMPAAVGKDDAAAQGKQCKDRNQPGDSTQHFKDPHG